MHLPLSLVSMTRRSIGLIYFADFPTIHQLIHFPYTHQTQTNLHFRGSVASFSVHLSHHHHHHLVFLPVRVPVASASHAHRDVEQVVSLVHYVGTIDVKLCLPNNQTQHIAFSSVLSVFNVFFFTAALSTIVESSTAYLQHVIICYLP